MDPSNRENKKKSRDTGSGVKVTEGVCSCKRPRTPLSNMEVKEGQDQGQSLRSSFSNGFLRGLRSLKNNSHNKCRCQVHTEGRKSVSDKTKRHSCGFTPIHQQNGDTRMSPEFDQLSRSMNSPIPMDIAYRGNTPSPMDCSSSRPTTPSSAMVAPRGTYPRLTSTPISGPKPGQASATYQRSIQNSSGNNPGQRSTTSPSGTNLGQRSTPSPSGTKLGQRSTLSPSGTKLGQRSTPSPSGRKLGQRSTPSPSGSRQGPVPVAYTIMRPKVPSRSNSRIGISLDMVDLWDPETDIESELEESQSGFDRINGIAINPRKTVDLSELRRNGAFSEFERAQSPLKQAQEAMMDRLNQETGSESQNEAHHDARARRRENGSAGRPRVRMTSNMRAHLTYPPNPSSPRNNSPCNYNNIAKDSSRSKEATTGREATPISTHQSQQRTHTSQTPQRTLPILIKKNSKSRPQESSPKVPPQHRVLNQTYDFTDSANSSPSSRRVNFNNIVTVQDGELSTEETLRNSNNSAQLIKQKYLAKLLGQEEGIQL